MPRRPRSEADRLWTHSIQALVTKEVSDLLDQKAARLGLSRSAAGRRAIELYVQLPDPEPEPEPDDTDS